MAFITVPDYEVSITTANLSALLGSTPDGSASLAKAQDTAIVQARDYLFERFDTDAIFGAVADARHSYLVKVIVSLALYHLYSRLPQRQTPEHIRKEYDEAVTWLERLADGKMSADLARRSDADNQPNTLFRWGSVPKRSH